MQKIDFSSYIELAVTMGSLGVGMWWLFDRSKGGLLLSFVLTVFSTGITVILLYCYDVRYTHTHMPSHHSLTRTLTLLTHSHTPLTHTHRLSDPRFFFSRLWCIYFSGCITFGTIGRRLSLSD